MPANTFGKVALLLGGRSAERDISLLSGQRVYQALTTQGIACQLIDPADDQWLPQLLAYGPDCAFIALHGTEGEDGTVQGLLDMLNIPYTGSKVLSSALAMDKYRSKLIWQSMGLSTPSFQCIHRLDDVAHAASLLPAFVKPTQEGSSVGMSRVDTVDELAQAWQLAHQYHGQVLVEQRIDGPEFTVGILNGRALPVIKIVAQAAFYDYQAKYLSNDTGYIIPCGLSAQQEQAIQQLALAAFTALGCTGWGRVDLMQDKQGRFWLLEVNTVPGMTDHSLVPMAAQNVGLTFEALVLAILSTAKPTSSHTSHASAA